MNLPIDVQLDNLNLQPGDIVVVKHPTMQQGQRQRLIDTLEGMRDTLGGEWGILFLPEPFTIDKLSDEQLASCGLCRIDQPVVV